ncbi:MAG TPA: hypothetical protein VK327_02310 [Candidatus Paceibacterota bacterium]|nr:hypothetical protein [Candidatus Paceibacterota bacterium]
MQNAGCHRRASNAHPSLQGSSVLLWLLGDCRTIREDARLYFRRTIWSEEDDVKENGAKDDEPAYRDSYSEIDLDEADNARVLEFINEFLPVKEMAVRLIGVPVLRQFGLVENERVDGFPATAFGKCENPNSRRALVAR